MTIPRVFLYLVPILALTTFSTLAARVGGPDAFGYSFIDSNEPSGPDYSWVEIHSTGTAVTLGDDAAVVVPLGGSFSFYGATYTNVAIGSNAAISFSWVQTWFPTSGQVPNPGEPNAVVALLWMDMMPSGACIFYQNMGDGRFIVEYDSLPEFGTPTNRYTMEVILYLTTGEIVVQYKNHWTAVGTSWRIGYMGIEDALGAVGLSYCPTGWTSDSTFLTPGLAISYRARLIIAPEILLNFESDSADCPVGGGGWQWGFPAYGPAAPYSGTHCWGTNLSGPYENGCYYTLQLPLTNLVGQTRGVFARFRQWYQTADGNDGGNVKISTDDGGSWNLLTPVGGYPVTLGTGSELEGEPGFSGTSSDWELAEFDLHEYLGQQVVMRLDFAADHTGTAAGWYFDDFEIFYAYGQISGICDLAFEPDNSGAIVTLVETGDTAVSSYSGAFFIATAMAEIYTLSFAHEGFDPATVYSVVVAKDETTTVNTLLTYLLFESNFEADNGHLRAIPVTGGWEWGHSDSVVAHSGEKLWGTGLNTYYPNNSLITLQLTTHLEGTHFPMMSFWEWHQVELITGRAQVVDGINIKLARAGDTTFNVIYPDSVYAGSRYESHVTGVNRFMAGQPSFGDSASNGNGWHQRYFRLWGYDTTVVLHFDLGSDAYGNYLGWYIDDIRIYDTDDADPANWSQVRPIPYAMLSPVPNPSSEEMVLRFTLEERSAVRVEVRDMTGRLVRTMTDECMSAGDQRLLWDGRDDAGQVQPGGMYLFRVLDGKRVLEGRGVLVK